MSTGSSAIIMAGRPDRVVCAGVIGIGCTIGIRKMARISHPISESELENAVNWLIEPQRVRLFCDRKSAAAFLLATSPLSVPSPNPVSPIVVEAGACVEWDGLKVRIVHVGRTAITLQGEHDKPIEICHANWDALLKKGGVRPVRSEIRADEEIGDGPRMETAASHRIAQPPGIDTKPFRGAKRKLFSQTCPTELND